MKVGIIRYPGSNCDNDILRYFDTGFYIWHTETNLKILDKISLLVIPGGFAFGDRYYKKATGKYEINPGHMAIESPVTNIILEAARKNITIVGICNGFQILLKLGLLPGELKRNNTNKFQSRRILCSLKDNNIETEILLDTANLFGNYQISGYVLSDMKKNGQIFLEYKNDNNGSINNIAGVCNKERTIFGMMPHPERTNNTEVKKFIYKIVDISNKCINEHSFKTKIDELIKSEHISYKSTKHYLRNLFTKAPHVVQGPGENAGIIDIGDGYCLALRMESHNHPIFIDPYNGAATGVGGILRDIFTMGARPIAIMDFLRFGTDKYNDSLIDETIRGISDYGNCFGVANIGGDFYRNKIYNKNPLLNVACLGIVKKENIIYGNALNVGSLLIYVGSKTGNEGINGALMSSNQFKDMNFDELKKNIQVGDPFLERLLLEACSEISIEKIVEGMQDMGAGGVLCASVEVIKRGIEKTGVLFGCRIDVDKIPVKYEMDDCDKLISESQERMLIVATPENTSKIFEIFKKWDLEYSVIGIVNDTNNYSVYKNNTKIFEQRIDEFSAPDQNWDTSKLYDVYEKYSNIDRDLKVKKTKYWEEYDNTIGCRTIKGPLDPGHYSILDIYEINKKLAVTWGSTFDICHSKILELHAKPLGVINCMNFGHPEDSMGSFVKILEDFSCKCEYYGVPIVGGNVSLYNATDNISIKPTPVFVMVGII